VRQFENYKGELMRVFFILLMLVSLGSGAYAKVSLNSMCYVLNAPGKNIEGDHVEELFEIASVSKVVTAYWALRVLGPTYNYQTRIHITRISTHHYDVHIQGSRDPFWGRELTHFLFAELNRLKITRIRNLTFDENLTFRWQVVTDFVNPLTPSADEIAKELQKHILNLGAEYPRTRREAASAGLSLPRALSLQVQNTAPLSSINFQTSPHTQTFVLKSAPLVRYLKEMNLVSNNHVADHLFDFLGGVGAFNQFMAQDMQMGARDFLFVNGSGDSIIAKDSSGAEVKEYNKASCETMIRILIKLDSELKKYGMGLKDVMAVSGTDTSTLNPRFDSIPNTMIGKTGTVDPAITMAGVISTANGDVYFGIFLETDGPADWGNGKDQVRSKVFDLIQRYGGGRSFQYATRSFMPFDQESRLVLIH
jgi:D-alanyl-D-alanine carboxypeptidase/D-alanyl-D-alanine-endopeptidase (penicillin-binding protein 4)